jgi:hypothetical protein
MKERRRHGKNKEEKGSKVKTDPVNKMRKR